MIGPGHQTPRPHTPVLLSEVTDAIGPQDGATIVDATFGAGGYTRALLEAAQCTVWAIDRDPAAKLRGAELEKLYPGRMTVLTGCYGDMIDLLADVGVERVDGIAFDIGVSSMQIDEAERGFSFRNDGPLDMRMGVDRLDAGDASGMTAADVVNTMAEEELANVIYAYGEERKSRWIAKAIVEARAAEPFTRTGQLADVVRRVVKSSKDGIDPATRTFQALRIYVNDELGELDRGLAAAEALLAPGGRLAVVSFHSLEDRKVKAFLRQRSGGTARPSRHLPDMGGVERPPSLRLIKRGAIKPTDSEIAANPRARSARLRVAERTDAPAWPVDDGRDAA